MTTSKNKGTRSSLTSIRSPGQTLDGGEAKGKEIVAGGFGRRFDSGGREACGSERVERAERRCGLNCARTLLL
jgi:hypothetical protein